MAKSNQAPSSSRCSTCESNHNYYDVFLSFRIESTFTSTLRDALRNKGINSIFIDRNKNLRKRKRKRNFASPDDPLKAIEKSRIAIVVFSENYASSTECLDELLQILKCRRKKKQVVFPIFYEVEPSDVRHQRNRYGEAMRSFKEDFRKVEKWRSALKQAAGLSGWHFQDGFEYEIIEKIVEEASSKLPPKCLHNGDHIVALDTCIEEVKSFLNTACVLGIHGPAGIGKTTLAKAAYNSILHEFEGASFLFNVREASKRHKGMVRLQRRLLSEILYEKKKIKLSSVEEGISKIKHRLRHKRVLLVLDDVNEAEQVEQLVGDGNWFGNGSRIVITTRNKQLLTDCRIEKEYQVKELNDNDSLEVFSWYAFHLREPPIEYESMSKRLVTYAQGLPLALKVIGSNLKRKSLEAWECALEHYERIPERKVQDVLKIMGKMDTLI